MSEAFATAAPCAVEPRALYATALAERLHSTARLRERAVQLRALADLAAEASGRGARHRMQADIIECWAEVYDAHPLAAKALADAAWQAGLAQGDAEGAADARDLLARLAIGRRAFDEARALLEANLALPEAARSPLSWCITFYRLAVLGEQEGHFDEALRWHYRNIAMAQRSGLAAEQAMALAGAGGLQLSMHNLEDGAAQLGTAWDLVHPRLQAWGHVWPIVAVNHLSAMRQGGDLRAAQALAAVVQARLDRFAPGLRHRVQLMLAHVAADAGELALADALLEAGLAGSASGHAEPVEWVVAQARLDLQRGQPALALQRCEAHLAAAAAGRLEMADTPVDLHLLHGLRTQAQRVLGNEAGAIVAERAAIAAERALMSSAARAQRLTLQVRYELQTAERARDAAQERAEHAQREQQRLAELNAALAEASRAKTRWMAEASHDLRQPLQALGLQLALLGPLLGEASPATPVAARMQAAHDALKAMFDALLNLSHIDAGAVVPQRCRVALRPLCAQLVDELSPRAQARGLRVVLRLGGAAEVTSDPALLQTLLRNLLDNAIKYTPRGGVVLALRAPLRGCAGQHGWRIQVRDTGPGIAPEHQARAFAEFVRLPQAPAAGHDADGLGLGLSIVQRLARLLGHRVSLRSRAGRGCLFELSFDDGASAPPPAAAHSDAADL